MARYFGFEPVQSGEYYFISYNSEESDRVGAVALEMYLRGIPLWYDRGLLAGKKWEKQITDRIKNCHEMVIFITKKLMARQSPYVRTEYILAKNFKKRVHIIVMDDISFEDVSEELQSWFLDLEELHEIYLPQGAEPQAAVDTMESNIPFLKLTAEELKRRRKWSFRLKSSLKKHRGLLTAAAAILVLALVGTAVVPRVLSASEVVSETDTVKSEQIDEEAEWYRQRVAGYDVSQYDDASIYTYTETDYTITITGLADTTVTELHIPPVINNKLVTEIGDSAFFSCKMLKTVTVPDSVVTLEDAAFARCTALTTVTLPESVTSIGKEAFSKCSALQTVNLPSGIVAINDSTFEECKALKFITIPDGVTYIGMDAFYYCSSLTAVDIPESVDYIGYCAFYRIQSLAEVNMPTTLVYMDEVAFGSCPSLKAIKIPDGITSIGRSTFSGCSSIKTIEIPDGVTSIGSQVFSSCDSLISVTIPESVTSIDSEAFDYNEHTIIIYGKADSYAAQYAAKKSQLTFMAIDG